VFSGIAGLVSFLNGWIWSKGMLVLVVGSGFVFSIGLGFFQLAHFKDMWKRIFDKGSSDSGISTFGSFCTTMAARIGTGNVAGVAVAIYLGGPGALFWMWVVGVTNSALAFVECTLGQLYKIKIDGEYRGSGAYCAERGLGWRKYGTFMAVVLMIGAACFMPAAATYTICDGFRNALGVPMWLVAAIIAALLAVIIIGGIKRISQFAIYCVPFMTVAYLLVTAIVLITHATEIPSMFVTIIKSAFGADAAFGGIVGSALLQGIKRGTFSSAAGMGESTPAASAAETSHPVKQGMANAAGVWLDTIIVCTATGFMILLTDCFNVADVYVGQGAGEMADLAAAGTNGVIFVQYACRQIVGNFAPLFIAIILSLFSFTCIISYYYEAETSALYLFQGDEKAGARKTVTWILRIAIVVLVFIFGIAESSLAWDLSDLALGACTWVNIFMLWFLFPKTRDLYKDYIQQLNAGKDPYYDPDKLSWPGVEKDMWREINKDRIIAGK
jgi:AGCS family alanine or glycine:cation symporter